MPQLTEKPTWLRASTQMGEIGVDRENNVIRGYVLAQEGPFKSEGRGEFDLKSLKQLKALANKAPNGLKSRLAHPTLSSDGIGKFLGRAKNPQLSTVQVMRDGKLVALHALRGDLHLDKTALEEPVGGGKPIGLYVMDLAESDPDALSSSVVLQYQEEWRLDPKTKRPMLDANGNEMPPLWRPTALHASDIVDTGDAVDGLLSAQLSGMPDGLVRQASELLDKIFPGESRQVVESRLNSWLTSYLSYRYGDAPDIEELIEEGEVVEHAACGMSRDVAKLRTMLAANKALG